MMAKKHLFLLFLFVAASTVLLAQDNGNKSKFKQLHEELPTPNVYRNAAGAPGHAYWQQKADYVMEIELDEKTQRLSGKETITYTNNSPDALEYLWLQLDQNMRAKDSDSYKIRNNSISDKMSIWQLRGLYPSFEGGFNIEKVANTSGKALPYVIQKTMMRIDLDQALEPGKTISFQIDWWYNINDRSKIGGRSGYEYFEEDDNYLFTIAQFFPRMCVYNEVDGWQNKQFLGRGEFTLTFGDYDVKITVPADHYVASTGVLQNEKAVLSSTEQKRFAAAGTSDSPILIVTEEEAIKNEKEGTDKTKTWHFVAENVRDFAFASSRKFIWDAMNVQMSDGRNVLAMSMYPKEGNPLWGRYSTKVVAHTLKWYSHYTFDYPYPVAWSIHTDRIGMEYPMICFNGGRPDADGTYSERTKYGMISVIIHEVGHNYFPMIVNSDERQWTWMDEGLNTYVQYLAEQQWEREYPSRRGPAHKIVDYMKGDKDMISPIMTNSESIFQFGNNAYGKPATALNILRETVVGREQFDHAFRIYSRRWMFKQPTPSDLFRTLEDASGVDLDWFWRGWFFTNDHVDIGIENVRWFKLDSKDPAIEKTLSKKQRSEEPEHIGYTRNRKEIEKTQDEIDPSLRDFYTTYDPLDITPADKRAFASYMEKLSEEEKTILEKNNYFYELTFNNVGGLVMPLIVEFEFIDGSKSMQRIPAEVWLRNNDQVTKIFPLEKEVRQIRLDPYLETADTDRANNAFPPINTLNKFELYTQKRRARNNPMRDAQQEAAKDKKGTD